MMLSEKRYQEILALLQAEGHVKTAELTKRFRVSGETIRRDLDYLETKGHLKKVYGGAVREIIDSSEPRFTERKTQYLGEKQAIAQTACRFVKEGMSVALDISTTNLEVAKALKQHFERLTILTNSMAIAMELADSDFDVILTGGRLLGRQFALVGEMCLANLRQYNIDLYFISTNGISIRAGITDFGFDEVEAKKVMAEIAARRILVAASNRFEVISLLKVADLSDVECIITDAGLDPKTESMYQSNGVHIVKAH